MKHMEPFFDGRSMYIYKISDIFINIVSLFTVLVQEVEYGREIKTYGVLLQNVLNLPKESRELADTNTKLSFFMGLTNSNGKKRRNLIGPETSLMSSD